MKKRIFDNWILKLVSVVCAVLLWIIVYNSEDPVEFERFYNVQVMFENTDVLAKEGKVYEVLENSDVIRTISVQAKRSVMDELSADDIHVVADFNNMKMDGTIELEAYSERHANGEITFKLSSSEVKLFVENKTTKQLSLILETQGEVAEGYIVGTTKLSQNRFSISGGESVVKQVSKAVAVVDITNATEDISTSVAVKLYDENGIEISTDKLSMTMETVNATVEVLATKTVPIVYEISGEVAEGYVATGEVTYGAAELLIAGKPSALAHVSEIVVDGEELSVEGAEEDVVLNINLESYLPSDVSRADKTISRWVEVVVKVVPIIEQKFTLAAKQVTIKNVPEEHYADRTLDTEEFTITVRGAQHLVEQLDESTFMGTIDITAWMKQNNFTELGIGTVYEIVPEFDLGEEFEVVSVEPIDVVAGIVEEK